MKRIKKTILLFITTLFLTGCYFDNPKGRYTLVTYDDTISYYEFGRPDVKADQVVWYAEYPKFKSKSEKIYKYTLTELEGYKYQLYLEDTKSDEKITAIYDPRKKTITDQVGKYEK